MLRDGFSRAAARNSAQGGSRAQASIEFITLYGLLLIPILMAFFYAYASLADSTTSLAGASSASELQRVLDDLSGQGAGATALTTVIIPANYASNASYFGTPFACAGPYVSLAAGGSSFVRRTSARVIGDWPATPGVHAFNLTVSSSGVVVALPSSQSASDAAARSWVLASSRKGASYAVFEGHAGGANATGLLSNGFSTSAFGVTVPAVLTVHYAYPSNATRVNVVCVSENVNVAGTCSGTLWYRSGGVWASASLGSADLTGRVTVLNATATVPNGFTDVTVRATATDGLGTTVNVQQPVVRQSAWQSAFVASFFGGSTRTGALVDGACPAPADEPCTDSLLSSLNEYRAYGVSGAGNTATCHVGAW